MMFSFIASLDFYVSSLPTKAVSLYLDKVLDWDQGGVEAHLDEIAYQMIEWEQKLAVKLEMTEVDIHDIKERHRENGRLQR